MNSEIQRLQIVSTRKSSLLVLCTSPLYPTRTLFIFFVRLPSHILKPKLFLTPIRTMLEIFLLRDGDAAHNVLTGQVDSALPA